MRLVTVTVCLVAWLANGSQPVLAQNISFAAPEVGSIDLPFEAQQLAVSADGDWAVVWDVRRDRSGSDLAIIDLPRRQLTAQTILQFPVQDAVIGDAVYVADQTGIRQLSRENLLPAAIVEVTGKPLQLRLVANRRLSTGPGMRYSLPDLTRIEDYDHDIHESAGWLDGRCGFGWLLEGVLWDEALSRPLLLAWPYEFQRVPWQNVLTSSGREPGPFQPATGAWHPFPGKVHRAAGQQLLTTATSPDIAATLGLLNERGVVQLTSFRLDNGERITSVPLQPQESKHQSQQSGPHAIATGRGRFAVLLPNRLCVGSLQALWPDATRLPFHVVPRQSCFVLATDGPTTVGYEAAGATRYRLASRALGRDGQPFEAVSANGEFMLSVSAALPGILKYAAGLAANLNQGRTLNDNRQRAELYARPSRSAFRQLIGQDPAGVLLPVGVEVTAEGTDFETATLRHDFLVDVPLDQLIDTLDEMYPAARDPWKKPAAEVNVTEYPESAKPPSGQGGVLQYLRSLWATPHPQAGGESLREAARQAKAAGDQRLHARYVRLLRDRQWRTWTDVEGRQVEALLVQYFAGQVTLRARNGRDFTFDESRLSAADREVVQKQQEPVTPNDSEAWREFVFVEALRAANRFESQHQGLPPRALTDGSGQPRLSWRVLLLPHWEYTELFALFRFDEPWNGPHNRELIPYMPDALTIDPAVTGKTTLLAVSSPLAAIQTAAVLRQRDFGSEADHTVIFVEATPDRGCEWTRPTDLALFDFAEPGAVVRSRDGQIRVGLLNGKSRLIPADTSRDDWRWVINRGDHRRVFETATPGN